MTSLAQIGESTLTLDNRVFQDLADGDTVNITFPNEEATLKTGKNGNTIFVKNVTGKNADVEIRILRGSSDDRFMANKLERQSRDFDSVINGTFSKRILQGSAVVRQLYTLSNGIVTKSPDTKENVEADTEQGVTIYNLRFADVTITTT